MRALATLGLAAAFAVAGCGGGDADENATPASGAPIPGGGLTVREAIDSELEGPLQVKGFLREEDGELRLCSAILESFPPQCGEPSLRVAGFDLDDADGVQSGQGVRWVEQASLLGEVEDRLLTVAATASG